MLSDTCPHPSQQLSQTSPPLWFPAALLDCCYPVSRFFDASAQRSPQCLKASTSPTVFSHFFSAIPGPCHLLSLLPKVTGMETLLCSQSAFSTRGLLQSSKPSSPRLRWKGPQFNSSLLTILPRVPFCTYSEVLCSAVRLQVSTPLSGVL